MIEYKIAFAIDEEDLIDIEPQIYDVCKITKFDARKSFSTSDNTYVCFYWDAIEWGRKEMDALEKALKDIRHAIVKISKRGEIQEFYKCSDTRGEDEEFKYMLLWNASIAFWNEGNILKSTSKPVKFTSYSALCIEADNNTDYEYILVVPDRFSIVHNKKTNQYFYLEESEHEANEFFEVELVAKVQFNNNTEKKFLNTERLFKSSIGGIVEKDDWTYGYWFERKE